MVGIVVTSHFASIASHDVLRVLVEIAGEILRGGMVGGSNRPSHGQLTRRIHLTRQQVGDGVSTLHTGLPSTENGIGVTAP